jgi:hypothetical protein
MSGEFKRMALGAPAALLAVQPLPAAAADEPRILAPSADWTVTSDGESCVMTRQLGGVAGVTLGVQAFAPGSTFYNVILRGDPLPHRDPGSLDFELRVSPGNGVFPMTGVLRGRDTPRVTFPITLAPDTAVDGFVVTFSRGRPLSLEFGPMAEALGRLEGCTAALPQEWGLDPAVQRTLSRPPLPIDIAGWLGPGSYPWEYLRNSLSVRVHLRLMTDARGGVSECVVQAPRGENIAGAVACREVVKTARFEPALDAEGRPVPGYFTTSIFYNTPRSNGPLAGQNSRQTLCC